MPRAKRICGKPSCPNPADGRYCAAHNAEYEVKRGTPQQRGYDATHRRLRARVSVTVQTGNARCVRCGQTITPGTAWHLDHTDDRTGYLGAAHATCNTSAGGKKAHPTTY